MKFDAQKALIAYSGALTAVFIGVMVSGAVQGIGPGRFTEIDVQRINVREPDGTLRMVISNQTDFPEIPYRGREVPHPERDTAGMLFMNEEGTEVGGLRHGVRGRWVELRHRRRRPQQVGGGQFQRHLDGAAVGIVEHQHRPVGVQVEGLLGLHRDVAQFAAGDPLRTGKRRAAQGWGGHGTSE